MELQPKMIDFNWWIWRVTNDPAGGARISFKETSFSTVQQELYSRMVAWTGQKGLGDGRLYGITAQMFCRWLAYPRGEDAFGWFSASMLVEYSWVQMSFNHIQPAILQEPWASLFNSRDLQVQDGRWKKIETSKCTVWLRFMARFFERNSAFLQETCMPSIFEESLYHQVDLTNHFMSGSRRMKK